MYSYKWNRKTGGYTLVPQTGKFVAAEIRPVFAEELKLIGFDEHFDFGENEKCPICWAKQNTYLYRGEEIAKLEKTQYGRPLTPNYLVGKELITIMMEYQVGVRRKDVTLFEVQKDLLDDAAENS